MNKLQILNDLAETLVETEVRTICQQFNLDYDAIRGETQWHKSRKLIREADINNGLPELVRAMIARRPSLAETYDLDALSDETEASHSTTSLSSLPSDDAVNPFFFGRRVENPEMFFGRRLELQRLRANLKNMNSCSIVSLRRIGKSSLLYHLSTHALPQDQYFLTAYIDLQDVSYHDLSGLLNGILTCWYQKLGRRIPPVNGLRDFSRQAQQLRQEGWKPVVCLDEFERLSMRPREFNEDVFESWRALASNGNLAFVTTSQKPLGDLIQQSGLTSNFDNIFATIDLGLLTESEARQLVKVPLSRVGMDVRETEVDQLLTWAGRYPFYLQMATFFLFEAMQLGVARDEHVQQQFAQQAERHWRGLWRALPEQEQTALHTIVGTVLAAPNTPVFLQRLARKGVVLRRGDAYQPFSRGFAEFIAAEPVTSPSGNPGVNNRAAMRQRYQTLLVQKAALDKKAEQYGTNYILKFAAGLTAFYVGLAVVTIVVGWDRMEPITYFLSAAGIVGLYLWLALTRQEWNPEQIRAQIVAARQQELYVENGFDEAEFETLQAQFGEED